MKIRQTVVNHIGITGNLQSRVREKATHESHKLKILVRDHNIMIYKNIFTPEEISSLQSYFTAAPINAVEANSNVNKNLDYHVEDSLCRQIVYPKIHAILGDHKFGGGAYKECVTPYKLHYDNHSTHDYIGATFDQTVDKNKVVLIPLVEGTDFSTVTFDIFSSDNRPNAIEVTPEDATALNNLDLDLFSHIPEPNRSKIRYLPVDVYYQWQLGDALVWSRDQLHCSTNFLRNNAASVKKFIVIFLA